MTTSRLLFGLMILFSAVCSQARAAERPNILWITSEDNSPMLGCFGDEQAYTPRLDRLASEGIRYTNAFANAPVCSAARSTLIMGMYPPSVGMQHHRSRRRVPEEFLKYGEYLRQAGYYCTNNSKKDYNLDRPGQPEWDESSGKAHYKNRKPGQPFFAVFNLTCSHESFPQKAEQMRRSGQLPAVPRLKPEEIFIPPYHPREPDIVDEWINYYDDVTLMDKQAGRLLDELEQLGLAKDTIVFYYSDHGGALPRGKRYLYDSGTRVPLIIRFPKKWAHLAPASPGQKIDRLVSFVDFAPTLLSLAGVKIPEQMQGRAFLGEQTQPAEPCVFLFRGRMDERYDFGRAVYDGRFRYIRNFSPHLPYGQHYEYPFQVLKSMRAWHQAYVDGRCNPVQSAVWKPKPSEELYDTRKDPWEIHNLADDPQYIYEQMELRNMLFSKMMEIRDTGLIPESMFDQLAGDETIYDYVHDDRYPVEKILAVADAATAREIKQLPGLIAALNDGHPVIRYWGAIGCRVLGPRATEANASLKKRLDDHYAAVRIAAAQALGYNGERQTALDALRKELSPENGQYEVLAAVNALDDLRPVDPSFRDDLKAILKRSGVDEAQRVARYLLDELDKATEKTNQP